MNYMFSDRIASLQPSAIREILKATSDPSVIPFAAGNPAEEAFPVKEIAAISADIMAKEPIAALQYSISEGLPSLRESAFAFAQRHEPLNLCNDQCLIMSGAQQGVELSAKTFCNEGDTVICEDPSFIGSLNALRSYKLNLVGVPMESDGIDLAKLEEALRQNPRTKLLYLIPNFQNPSGITTSAAKRRAVYDLAVKYGVLILEDNPYEELRISGVRVPSIKSLDTQGIVLYCGSFSKVLSPGMRVGYIIAPAPAAAKLTVAKQCSDVHTTIWAQMVCDRFLRTVDMDAHVARLQEIYRRKCNLMLGEMDKAFHSSVTYTRPEGGLFIWAALPGGVDMMDFCRKAVSLKVAIVPGTAFTADTAASSQCFRLNFSTPSDEGIVKGVSILGELTHNL